MGCTLKECPLSAGGGIELSVMNPIVCRNESGGLVTANFSYAGQQDAQSVTIDPCYPHFRPPDWPFAAQFHPNMVGMLKFCNAHIGAKYGEKHRNKGFVHDF